MNLFRISLFVILTKIFQEPSVKGTLRYQKISFFTTSALSQLYYLGYAIIYISLPFFPYEKAQRIDESPGS